MAKMVLGFSPGHRSYHEINSKLVKTRDFLIGHSGMTKNGHMLTHTMPEGGGEGSRAIEVRSVQTGSGGGTLHLRVP